MKKLLLLTVFSLFCCIVNAQPWMPTGNGPVKFSDVIANYPKHSGKDDNHDMDKDHHGKVEQEGMDYQFDKWAWYWGQHLDENGYIVSPMKTVEEWQKYVAANKNVALSKTTSTLSNWVFQGPHQSNGGYAGIGRINVVAFDPVDSNTIYIGSAAGSTWKSTNGGHTWAALYNNLPTLGVADIKVNPLNGNTIYVATGDGDASDAYSSGVIKSYDGGSTWLTTGLNWPPTYYRTAHSLIINPTDTNTMILASSAGTYITHDAGNNWILATTTGMKQVLFNPNDTNIVYGTTAGGTGQILRSKDGGNTWTTVTTLSGSQRINIAVSRANSSVVMAIADNSNYGLNGVYRSSDTGATFTPVFVDNGSCANNLLGYDLGLPTTNCNGQGWYDLCIAMDPQNENNVIVGGVNTYYSYNGGVSWALANQWYATVFNAPQTVHADKHCLAYNPLTGGIYETCDGGVYKSYSALSGPWTDLTNGLGITEFYKVAIDNGVTFAIGGAQDNGTKMVNAGVATDLTGGDGMQCRINYQDPSHIFYSGYPNGAIDISFDGGVTYNSITGSFVSSGDWVTPYIIHPVDPTTIFLGYDTLFVSHDYGNTWAPASPRFAANINTIAVPFTNGNYIYVVVDDNTIHYSTNYGASWTAIPPPASFNISDLVVDPKNEKRFWITASGYTASKVWGYDLSTHTWTNEAGTLPNIPVNCMTIDSASSTQYIGTDAAVFYKDTTMTDWALFNTNLPGVRVSDLGINYTTGEMWAATFGRGLWKTKKSDQPSGIRSVAVTASAITVYPDPNRGSFTINTTYKELIGQNVTVKLISPDGRTAWQKDVAFDNTGDMKINAAGVMKGNYICVVSNKNMITRSRVLIY